MHSFAKLSLNETVIKHRFYVNASNLHRREMGGWFGGGWLFCVVNEIKLWQICRSNDPMCTYIIHVCTKVTKQNNIIKVNKPGKYIELNQTKPKPKPNRFQSKHTKINSREIKSRSIKKESKR